MCYCYMGFDTTVPYEIISEKKKTFPFTKKAEVPGINFPFEYKVIYISKKYHDVDIKINVFYTIMKGLIPQSNICFCSHQRVGAETWTGLWIRTH